MDTQTWIRVIAGVLMVVLIFVLVQRRRRSED